jgi:ABC-type lipoprotein export system ATPase subunit
MLKLQNISKYYHSNDVVALGLRKVSLEFKLGEFVAVTGESGSGKSTLLNVISGLDTYEDGEMYVNGEETSYFNVSEWESYRRQYIGFVFQNYNIIDSYSVLENVMVALTIQGYDKDKRKERALELIEKVGLSSHIHHKASKLSGGQKQRAVIARALAKDCPIIVADEPTGNLDSETGDNIMALLKELSENKLVIVVTHNYDQVKDYATRKIRLFDGEVVEDKAIKKRQDIDEGVTLANYQMTYLNMMGMAIRNLFRTPRRTIFTTIVAIFIAAIFVFSYGSYVSGRDTIYFGGGGYFRNVTERRIIVTKFDKTAFTDTQLQTLEDLNRVQYLLEHDMVMETEMYSLQYYEEWDYYDTMSNYINPAGMLNESDLKAGRLPQNEFEVVVEDYEEYQLGGTVELSYNYFWYDEERDLTEFDLIEFEIVGIVKNLNINTWQRYLYFHDDFINSEDILYHAYQPGSSSSIIGYGDYYYGGGNGGVIRSSIDFEYDGNTYIIDPWFNYVVDDTLADNEVQLGYGVIDEFFRVTGLPYPDETSEDTLFDVMGPFDFDLTATSSFYENTNTLNVTGIYVIDEEDIYRSYDMIAMNQKTYRQMVDIENVYQISLLVLDSYDANIILEELEGDTYNAIYPSAISDPFSEIFALIQNIWFTFLMIALMVVMYFITYVVLRNVQNAKKKDYLIFRSIGASKKDLHKVTIIELIYVFVFAFIIVMTFLIINELSQIWEIPQYLRYFNVWSYLILTGMLVLLALFLGRRFNSRIFSKSVITSLKQE